MLAQMADAAALDSVIGNAWLHRNSSEQKDTTMSASFIAYL
jgi:hypothetical protein